MNAEIRNTGKGQSLYPHEFNHYLITINTEWKRLRNFIKYLEGKKWGKV